MGIPVMVLGASGSGKSASMRNLVPETYGVFNVASKPLPFRSKDVSVVNLPSYTTQDGKRNYDIIIEKLARAKRKTYVIDDSQYLLCFEMFNRAKEPGYGKFTEMAQNFYDLIMFVINYVPQDVIVYFLHHSESKDDGRIKAKTVGKMLDEKLTVEGLFSIVLLADNTDGRYRFITHSDGKNTVKSPIGMFDGDIDNDLAIVDSKIREYYGI